MGEAINPFDVVYKDPFWLKNKYKDVWGIFESLKNQMCERKKIISLPGMIKPSFVASMTYDIKYSYPLSYSFNKYASYRYDPSNDETVLKVTKNNRYSVQKITERVNKLYYAMDIDKCTTDLDKELAVNNWMTKNCVWDDTVEESLSQTMLGVLMNGAGVCSSFALCASFLLNSIGVECYTVLGDVLDNDYKTKMKVPKKTDYIKEILGEKIPRKYEELFHSEKESSSDFNETSSPDYLDFEQIMVKPPHLWNYVVINKKQRHLDVTFNAGGNSPEWYLSKHDYFNWTKDDREIVEKRKIILGPQLGI